MNRNSNFFDWNHKATIAFGEPIPPKDHMISSHSHEKYKPTAAHIMKVAQNFQIPKLNMS